MSPLDATLIVVIALAGAVGGTLVGVASTAMVADAAVGRRRRGWVRSALIGGLGCGIVLAAVGAWGLGSERPVLTSVILLVLGGWLGVTALRVLRRAGGN